MRTPNPLRVLQITPRYFPHMGGVETHVSEVTRRLSEEHGVRVGILTTVTDEAEPGIVSEGHIALTRLRSWPRRSDACFAPGVMSAVRPDEWDLIHVQGIHTLTAPMAMLAALRSHLPYVVTFHTGGHPSQLRNRLRGLQWRVLHPLIKRASALIGVSQFEATLFADQLGLPPSRFRVVRNGGQLPHAIGEPRGDSKRIVSVGRLERYKGHHRVIAAMPRVLAEFPDAGLLILGSGPFEPELKSLASQIGVAHAVEIRSLAPVQRAEMAQALASSAVCVLLSDYEAHPIAAMEAISLGVPTLVADTSGLLELAQQGLATQVSLHARPEALATAICTQLSAPMVPPLTDLPTWDGCAAQLHEIYEEVVSARCG